MTAEPYRLPRQTRNVRVRWKVTRAVCCLLCECGWTSERTRSVHDGGHGTALGEHIEQGHATAPWLRRPAG
jgi:hypothetical protein